MQRFLPFLHDLPDKKRKALHFCKTLRADNQIRTGDLILTKDALYLLSYISIYSATSSGNKDMLPHFYELCKRFFEFFQKNCVLVSIIAVDKARWTIRGRVEICETNMAQH